MLVLHEQLILATMKIDCFYTRMSWRVSTHFALQSSDEIKIDTSLFEETVPLQNAT
jgi:hypothetical protein